jgi:hypothetical protein
MTNKWYKPKVDILVTSLSKARISGNLIPTVLQFQLGFPVLVIAMIHVTNNLFLFFKK